MVERAKNHTQPCQLGSSSRLMANWVPYLSLILMFVFMDLDVPFVTLSHLSRNGGKERKERKKIKLRAIVVVKAQSRLTLTSHLTSVFMVLPRVLRFIIRFTSTPKLTFNPVHFLHTKRKPSCVFLSTFVPYPSPYPSSKQR